MSQAEWGAIIVALSLTSYLLGRFATLRAVGVFSGILLIGFGGGAAHVVAKIITFLSSVVGLATARLIGISGGIVLAAVVAVMCFLLLHDWHPRNPAKKRTFWVAAALAIMITAGATPFAVLNHMPATVRQGITSSGR